ncbi:hypothetical protein [Aeromonas allosaccharophila]|uniref:hypothetical protein n=1 Tax=Aeromonas allosaccharophila TaxID=656 RepID=UPI002AE08BDF|nr:hypothetical protein [Aeromonas allosaccharophila]
MKEKLIKRVDQIISQGEEVLSTRKSSKGFGDYVDSGKMKGFRSALLSFIERLYGKEHTFYSEVNNELNGTRPSNVEAGISILLVIKDEVAGDWLLSIKELVSAELFSDFIEMAQHLLSQKYKDPAAVIIGSVLEEHLRQLCVHNGIDIEVESEDRVVIKKADRLNNDLAKEDVYSKLDQKAVTMWLDLRNKAAHGKYAEYELAQVENMMSGVIEFITRSKLA